MNKLYVVGTGAGERDGLTLGAFKALNDSEVIVGYTVYCDLVRPLFPDKEYISTPMTRETERCRIALEHARDGKRTCMICSGDAGIYGLAAPILELAPEYGVEATVIPGVTAASSGAALLGAPLTCDFTVLSLSDLLTPMGIIEKRIEAAASCDIVTVIYNPKSRKRADYLARCCEIMLRHRSPDTVCGLARNVGREGENFEITTLAKLADAYADMFTTVFIGSSTTKVVNGKMVTPRGYGL